MPKTEIQKRVDALIKKHGQLRAAARAIGLDASYLCRLKNGQAGKRLPESTLQKLGLKRTETLKLL